MTTTLANRVYFNTATVGTGALTVGAEMPGFRTPAQAGLSTQLVSYVIEDGGTAYEIGRGTLSATGTVLSRAVLASSNANAAIALSGSARVLLTPLAEDFADIDAATVHLQGTETIAGAKTFGNAALRIADLAGAYSVIIRPSGTLTAVQTFFLKLNNATRTLDMSGDLTVPSAATVSGTNTGDQNLAPYALAADLASHAANTANPHAVTKAQVGLGSADNTADTAKPISTAAQSALDLKAPLANPTFTGTVSGVTKAMVGLGSADNTADTAKPISTATQTALNAKALATDLTAHTGNTSNPHGVTKAQVGLGSVDNTADTAKPVSTAQQAALDLKAALLDALMQSSVAADLNALGAGFTFFKATTTTANAPTTTNAFAGIQFYYSVNNSAQIAFNMNDGSVWVRNMVAAVWQAWFTLAPQLDAKFLATLATNLNALTTDNEFFRAASTATAIPVAGFNYAGIQFSYNANLNTQIACVQSANPAVYAMYYRGSNGSFGAWIQIGDENTEALKANIASPAFTGTPTAPTQAAGNNTTRLATTAFVQGELAALVLPIGAQRIISDANTTLVSADAWSNVVMSGLTANRLLNVPTNASQPIPIGTQIFLTSTSASNFVVTVTPAAGVAIRGRTYMSPDPQTNGITLTKIAANTWIGM